jgi:hypothetical protein
MQDDGPRPVPRQVVPEPELRDEPDGVTIGPEQVVVELLKPRAVRPSGLESRRQPTRNRLALEDRDVVAALRQAKGSG